MRSPAVASTTVAVEIAKERDGKTHRIAKKNAERSPSWVMGDTGWLAMIQKTIVTKRSLRLVMIEPCEIDQSGAE